MKLLETKLRQIRPEDDPHIARIIRDALVEFQANKPGTVYFDPTTDHLSEVFTLKGSAYFVLVDAKDTLLGGAGIFPTQGLPKGTVELVKMYLAPNARGMGFGKLLMQTCFEQAKMEGYDQVYLETMSELKQALPLYEKMGFRYLDRSMGDSGHHGCPLWMLRSLKEH